MRAVGAVHVGVPRPEDDAVADPRSHEQQWLDLSEAAAMTGLDREAVQSLVGRGLIPHRRPRRNKGATLRRKLTIDI